MSCSKFRSDKNKPPKLSESMIKNNQTYIWKAIKDNPNIYCWIPSSSKKYNKSNIDLKTINVQEVTPAPIQKNYKKILSKIIENAEKFAYKKNLSKFEENPDDNENAVSFDDKKKYKIVEEFLKRKQRILYGGTAINLYLPSSHKIYNSGAVPDYDFFSPTPWEDAVELAE